MRCCFLLSLFFVTCVLGCRPPRSNAAADVAGKKGAGQGISLLPAEFANFPLALDVRVTDTKMREFINANGVRATADANTTWVVSVAGNDPATVRIYQENDVKNHGIRLEMLGGGLQFYVSRVGYDASRKQIQVETDPRGLGVTGLLLSHLANWFGAGFVPNSVRGTIQNPTFGGLRELGSELQRFVSDKVSKSVVSQNDVGSDLGNLGMNIATTFTRAFTFQKGNYFIYFPAGMSLSCSFQTRGNLKNPIVESFNVNFSDLRATLGNGPAEKPTLTTVWADSVTVYPGGKIVAKLRTLVTKHVVNMTWKGDEAKVVRAQNDSAIQETIENAVATLLPVVKELVEKVDFQVQEVDILRSLGISGTTR